MIPTRLARLVAERPRMALLAALCVTLGVSACTNSKLVIAPLYNRLDNRIESQFTDLADFSASQIGSANTLIDTFHVWHRQSELPRYAVLLDTLSRSLRDGDMPDAGEIEDWFDVVQHLSERARQCHPINYSAPLIRSFSDEQVAAARESIQRERKEDRERYAEQTAEERRDKRAERFASFAARIGVDLNAGQKALLGKTLAAQISMREQHFAASDRWNETLFTLIEARADDDFAERLGAHLDTLFMGVQTEYPEQWASNRALWQEFAVDFVASLTTDQRRNAANWIGKLSTTLDAISRDQPSFTVSGNPDLGCQVDPGASGA